MKNIYLIITILFLFTGCSENEEKQQENILTENATVYYDSSAIDNCVYTIKTESNKFYAVESLDEIFRENSLMIRISYTMTDEKLNCGFSNNLTIIKIETITKI
tara:strand:- start:176 stop:487 length:312 start_codon:yes stop_codon:yes gene_type:complete